ncbi:MAG: transporter substrate-binding domain-containing protein [Pseudomonadota bacterium]
MRFAYLIEPPFNYRDEAGTVTGCDVELARMVFAQIGEGPATFIETEFAALLPGLGAGHWEMTTGLFATDERRAMALFSRPIWALPDGLLINAGNPHQLSGYESCAVRNLPPLAVIRDQFQHRSAVEFGVEEDRILIFETYADAATAVEDGRACAYASVGRAHAGFIAQNPDKPLEIVPVPATEKQPAFGCYGFARGNEALRDRVDEALGTTLGSAAHRQVMADFGFGAADVDAVLR